MLRKATIADIDGVYSVYEKVKLDRNKLNDPSFESYIQKNGFLLGLDSKETLLKEINEVYSFIVAEENNQIVGYLIADHRDEQKFYDDEYKTWFDLEIKDLYYHDPNGMTIASIAVLPEYSGKGIATQMLNYLEQCLINEGINRLFSIVTLAPLTNCPSIIWHSKNGFKRLAMGKPREKLFDLEWYSGVLLFKDLAQ
jgi:GNAT superfamily N-acetyltransferase